MRTEKCKTVKLNIYGLVQGVGFRWRAQQAANLYGCTGWVRNEWDGSVTMELQGEEEQINRVLVAVQAGSYVQVEELEQWDVLLVPAEAAFLTL